MNDRLKFRLLNKHTKQFEYSFVGAINTQPFSDVTLYDEPQFCTGLKDKNGTLVYFDDFIKNQFGQICKIVMDTSDERYGMVKVIPVSYFAKPYMDGLGLIPKAIKNSEIIGNIYTTPELLEVSE